MTPIRNILLLFIVCLSSLAAIGQTYINNVTIVDVESHQLIQNQTVVIQDGVISNIYSIINKYKQPIDAINIDGTGKYLIPGLTDAHVHFFQNGGLYTRPDAIDLRNDVPYQNEIEYSHSKMEEVLHRYCNRRWSHVSFSTAQRQLFKQQQKSFYLHDRTTVNHLSP